MHISRPNIVFVLSLAAAWLCFSSPAFPEVPDIDVEFTAPPAPPPPPPPSPPAKKAEASSPSPAGGNTVSGRQLIEAAGRELLREAAKSSAPEAPPPSRTVRETSPSQPQASPAASPPPKPDRSFEEQPAFRRPRSDGGNAGDLSGEGNPPPWEGPSLLKVFAALLLVLGGMAGALFWLRKLYYRQAAAGPGGTALQVVARTFVEPGRSVLLVRVGRRLLLLASTREGLNRVGEITDKDEVEEILRDAGQGARGSGFGKVLEENRIDLTDEDAE